MELIRKLFLALALAAVVYCGPEVLPERSGGAFWLTPQGAVVVSAASGGGVVIPVPSVTTQPRIFATALMYDGALGGVAGADAKCNSDPSRPTTGTYKAMLADDVNRRACSTPDCGGGASENIDWVFRANQLYYQADGITTIFTTNSAGIHDFGGGDIGNPFFNSSFLYWTGLISDWRTSGSICSSWNSNSSGPSSTAGEGLQTDSNAVNDETNDCDSPIRLLCVEQ